MATLIAEPCVVALKEAHPEGAVNFYRNRFHFPKDSNRHVPPKCCLLATCLHMPELGRWRPSAPNLLYHGYPMMTTSTTCPSARVPNWNKHRDWRPQPALPQGPKTLSSSAQRGCPKDRSSGGHDHAAPCFLSTHQHSWGFLIFRQTHSIWVNFITASQRSPEPWNHG